MAAGEVRSGTDRIRQAPHSELVIGELSVGPLAVRTGAD